MDGNDQTVAVLQGIWNEMKTLNSRVNSTNERLDRLTGRVDAGFERLDLTIERLDRLTERVDAGFERLDRLTERVDAGFARVDLRFDHLLLGEHGREHPEFRERLARLEQRFGLPPTAFP